MPAPAPATWAPRPRAWLPGLAAALTGLQLTLLPPVQAGGNGSSVDEPITEQTQEAQSAAGQPSVTYAYTVNLAGNPVGGIRPGLSSYVDNHLLNIGIPLGAGNGNLSRPRLIVDIYDRNGSDLSAVAIGNQFTVQQLFGLETLALYSIRFEAALPSLGGKLKLGRFTSGDDFAAWPYYGLAMNNAINGNPQSLPVNSRGFSSFPNAVWGAQADLAVGPQGQLRLGTFQVTDPDVLRYHGFNWSISPSDGLMLLGQLELCDGCTRVGWQAPQRRAEISANKALASLVAVEPSYPVHRRRLALGGYWSMAQQQGFQANESASSTAGAWLHGDLTLWQPRVGGPALAAWAAFTSSPQPEVAKLPLYWALGLVRYGLAPSRPQDSLLLNLYQGRISPSYLRSVGALNPYGASETVVELGYRVHIGRSAFVQPNVQVVMQPSGQPIPTALVLGMQAGFRF